MIPYDDDWELRLTIEEVHDDGDCRKTEKVLHFSDGTTLTVRVSPYVNDRSEIERWIKERLSR